MKKFIPVAIVLVIGVIVFFIYQNQIALAPSPSMGSTPSINSGQASSPQTSSLDTTRDKSGQAGISIYDQSRIIKKPFGIYITPKTSPIQPEKFSGYHTGADFETTTTEANIDVLVPAFCDGKLLMKKSATGYGGVIVQSCILNNQAVTVVYGHLKLASITSIIDQTLKKGDIIGVLGKAYSVETGGERKHLHLGIHIGSAINILGYAQKQSDLFGWLDPVIQLR